MIPITFIVIVATALIYGLSGGPVARALSVASTGPGGILVIGGTRVGRTIGRALQDRGLTVMLWTANDEHAQAAEAERLTVYRGNPIEDATADEPSDLDQLEHALVVGDDEAFCAMAATDLSEYFGRDHVFQLAPKDEQAADFYTRVTVLFDDSASHDKLLARIKDGAEITVTKAATEEGGGIDIQARPNAGGIPMFVDTPGADLRIIAAGDRPKLEAEQELIGLIDRKPMAR